ncbi:hypothetical protein GALL_509060 [mine drainage metagenome]|uniref:Uncharacterized protein n=1 Tax=mine drainage metagenome TaxID=410659 RepID=A0A1J5P8H5_9ZZZZ
MTLRAQGARKVGNLLVGLFERGKISQLAADMHVDPDHLQPWQAGGFGINLGRTRDRDAELVFLFAGRDFRMGLGVNVRIDPNGDRGDFAQRDRHLGQRAHLGLGFDVELPNTAFERYPHFLVRFANTREHDTLARNPRRLGAQVFASRDHIHAGAQIAKGLEHRNVRQGLDRKAHQMRQRRKRLLKQAEMAGQCRGRIAVERRADCFRQFDEIHRLGVKHAVAKIEVIHGALSCCSGAGRERMVSWSLWRPSAAHWLQNSGRTGSACSPDLPQDHSGRPRPAATTRSAANRAVLCGRSLRAQARPRPAQ